MDNEISALQKQLGELGQALATEHQRLDEAKRAGEAAVQHARDVRARVRQEAKRVAEMAAAAVMAAAADVSDTGEFPKVVPGNGDRPPRRVDGPAPSTQRPGGPGQGPHAQGPHAQGNGVPPQRAPHPATLIVDPE
jgi:hypothetical protein